MREYDTTNFPPAKPKATAPCPLIPTTPHILPTPPSLALSNTIISPESRIALNPAILDCPETSHKQHRKPTGPILQIPLRQTAHFPFNIRTHILIMILLVSQCPQQIKHFSAIVFPLFAECIDEDSVELTLPIWFCLCRERNNDSGSE